MAASRFKITKVGEPSSLRSPRCVRPGSLTAPWVKLLVQARGIVRLVLSVQNMGEGPRWMTLSPSVVGERPHDPPREEIPAKVRRRRILVSCSEYSVPYLTTLFV